MSNLCHVVGRHERAGEAGRGDIAASALPIACAWARVRLLRVPALLFLLVGSALVVTAAFSSRAAVSSSTAAMPSNPMVRMARAPRDLALALPSLHRGGVGVACLDALPWLIALAGGDRASANAADQHRPRSWRRVVRRSR